MKIFIAFLANCLILTTLIIPASAGTIAPELLEVTKAANPKDLIDIIIVLADQVDTKQVAETETAKLKDKRLVRAEIIRTLRSRANATQKNLITDLRVRKAKTLRPLWIINAVAATVPAEAIKQLAARPEAVEIRLDYAITLSEPIPEIAAGSEWNIAAVNAPELWDLGITGRDIVVANMDTGVDYRHNDLSGRWRGGFNSWFDPNGEHVTNPYDYHGHGTQTMGIMLGGDATGSDIGVAPGAQWIAVKIFSDAGYAAVSAIHQGFQWLLDPDNDPATDDAPDVVNNSWGYNGLANVCYLEFQQDIQTLQASGIAVIFSAGNEGPYPASSISPANNPESFAVGAVDSDDVIAWFSSRGPSPCMLENDFFPEVAAPGVDIKSATLTNDSDLNASALGLDGTSIAAPHVAGAMALLMQAFPESTPADLEAALMQSARDLGNPGPDDDYGYGMIDVLAAYRWMVPCTDADRDGYFAAAENDCGTALDCRDDDPGINPGAVETPGDHIDQDCNGYDLTIDILSATYDHNAQTLCVAATSSLGDAAALALDLDTLHLMEWNGTRWEIALAQIAAAPAQITVVGIEGTVSKEVTETELCRGDFDRDGDVDEIDLSSFAAAFGTTSFLPNYDPKADLDQDDDIDAGDLAIFAVNIGRTDCPRCPMN